MTRLESTMERWMPLVLLAIVVAIAGWWLLQIVAPFLMTLFVAAVLALLMDPAHEWLAARLPRFRGLAALLATTLVLGAVVLPLTGALAVIAREAGVWLSRWRDWSGVDAAGGLHPAVQQWLDRWSGLVGVSVDQLKSLAMEGATSAGQFVTAGTAGFLRNIPWIILRLFIFILALFFFFRDGPSLLDGLRRLSPLRADHNDLIAREFARVCRAVVWGQFLAGLTQALLLVLTLSLIAAFSPLEGGWWIPLLGLIVVVLSMIPFLGSTAVWLPTSIYFAVTGLWVEAVALTVVGAGLISTIDNVVKVWVIKDAVSMHPLFAFVCVFGGLRTMGILGVFVGPMLGAVVFALVRVLREDWAREKV